MNFIWNRLQLTEALQGSDYRIICKSTFEALAYQINRSKSQSVAVKTDEIVKLQNRRIFDNYRLIQWSIARVLVYSGFALG